MKVYLTNNTRAEARLEVGEVKSIGIKQGLSAVARLFDDKGEEIARLTRPYGWQQVSEGNPRLPYYKYCDIEES